MDHAATPKLGQAENPATAASWRLDQAASQVEFRVPHFWGLWVVKGRFTRFDGWLETDEGGPCRIDLSIEAASVTTHNPVRDRHLRAEDFFDAENHPEVRFRATGLSTGEAGSLRVSGDLAAAGHSISLELRPTFEQRGAELHIEAEVQIDQRRLGMTWSPLGMTRTPVTARVRALMRPETVDAARREPQPRPAS